MPLPRLWFATWVVTLSLYGSAVAAPPFSLQPTLLSGGPSDVNSVAVSPDGKVLAVGGGNSAAPGFIMLWDVGQRKPIRTFTESFGVISVAFSPDGGRLASSLADGRVRVREWPSGEDQFFMVVPNVTRLAFSPDGRYLATPTSSGEVRLWDAVTGKEAARLRSELPRYECATFSPDGNILAAGGGEDGNDGAPHPIVLWDVATKKQIGKLEGHQNAVFGIALSPDGKAVASSGRDGKVFLWDLAQRKAIKVLEGHTATSEGVAFSADGTLLISTGHDGAARLWDAKTGEPRGELAPPDFINRSAAFTRDGKSVFIGGAARTLTMWDVASRKEIVTLTGPEDTTGDAAVPQAVVCRPDGRMLAIAGEDHAIRLRDPATGDLQAVLRGHEDAVYCLAYSPDGKTLASGSGDRTVQFWGADGKPGLVLKGHDGWVYALAYSPDGKRLASAGYDRTVRIWDVVTGQELNKLSGHTAAVRCLAFAPDGQTLASGGNDGTIRLWDTSSLKSRAVLNTSSADAGKDGPREAVLALAYSPDGKILLSGGEDKSVRAWDPIKGQRRREWKDGLGVVTSLAFAPLGRMFVTGCEDGLVHVWNLDAEAKVIQWQAHNPGVTGLTFEPQTGALITAGRDLLIKKWPVPSWP